MLASVLRLSGLDQRLAAFKLRLDEKAYEAVDHVKAVVVRMFVVAALAVAAAGFALLALITGLVALYGWLEPTYGVFPALSIVGGGLAVIAFVLISAAMILSRGRPGSEKGTATPETIEVPPSPLPLERPRPFGALSFVRPARRQAFLRGLKLLSGWTGFAGASIHEAWRSAHGIIAALRHHEPIGQRRRSHRHIARA